MRRALTVLGCVSLSAYLTACAACSKEWWLSSPGHLFALFALSAACLVGAAALERGER